MGSLYGSLLVIDMLAVRQRLKFYGSLFGCLIFSTVIIYPVKAQENNDSLKQSPVLHQAVEWTGFWPADTKNQKRKFREHLNSWFLGIRSNELINPVAVVAENSDKFWVLDQGSHTIFRVSEQVGDIPHFITKSGLNLTSLVGICFGPDSTILFTDSQGTKIYSFNRMNPGIEIFNKSVDLNHPTGIAYQKAKNEIWVLETKEHRITIFSETGEVLRRIGSRGTGPAEFNYPTHLWIDRNGLVYVNDALNFRIQIIDAEGKFLSTFGKAGDATGYLARPKGIATDSHGNIYIVDALFHVVQVFNREGIFLYKFGNQGHGQDELWMPSGIFIDNSDRIYLADTYNSRIQLYKIIPKGTQ
jgi:DNA-binding beta-propeller fold protein YncE